VVGGVAVVVAGGVVYSGLAVAAGLGVTAESSLLLRVGVGLVIAAEAGPSVGG